MNHSALFDILFLGKSLQVKNESFTLSEIHILSYLSCLLSIYSGDSSKEWGYIFTKTAYGYPFSNEIKQAVDSLIMDKLLDNDGGHINVTKDGVFFNNKFLNFNFYSKRIKYLEASINCLSLTPFGVIRSALFSDPVLTSAKSKSKSILLEDNNYSTNLLFEQFKDLKSAINNEYESLVIPALTWMSGNLKHQIG